jgi:GNAT superfamily N-acetyltransferase
MERNPGQVRLDLRVCRDDAEKALSLAIYNAVWPQHSVSLASVHEWEAHASASVDLVARIDGEAVGSGAAAVMRDVPHLVLLLITVLATHRRRGIGSALYRELSQWALAVGVDEAEARVSDSDDESLDFAKRRGFRVHAVERGLALELAAVDPPPVAPPAGIAIVPYDERFARGVWEVGVEADPDVPGYEDSVPEPFEEWVSAWRPERTFVALAGDEVVGYGRLGLHDTRPETATHRMTGVKRAWRGRGIAGALKRAQIAWAKEEGLERLETTNEERNEPIRRLNLALGYRKAPGRILLRGPLAD